MARRRAARAVVGTTAADSRKTGGGSQMLHRVGGRGGWFVEVGLLWIWAAATGCGAGSDDGAAPVARNRLVGRPAELRRVMRPLTAAPDSHPSPDTRLALAPDATVDARVLVITADGTDAA